MFRVPRAPLKSRSSLIARLAAPVGAPEPRVHARAGTAVLSLPGHYSMTHLILAEDAVAVVDVGSVSDVPRIVEALQWLGRPLSQVRCGIVSHLHFDHVLGMDALSDRTGCPVAVSRRAWDAFQGGEPLRVPDREAAWHLFGGWAMQGFPVFPAEDWAVLRRTGLRLVGNPFLSPLLPLDPGDGLPGLPGWTVLHAPGHSDDALALHHAEAGFLVTGDTVRNYMGGEWNPIQVDPEAFRMTRSILEGLPVRTIFPGHGPVLEGEGIVRSLRVLAPWTP